MSGELLKNRRRAAGISGAILCLKVGIGRSSLCKIERGYIKPAHLELQRLFEALDELVIVPREVRKIEQRMGWPTAEEISLHREQEVST
jgi:transcriptional regulator with XRE-family HTH domain